MPAKEDRSTALQRLAALKLLRENILLSDPSTYSATDIAEDFPEPFKFYTQNLKNVLPSQAILSKNPEERKKQIIAAVKKIKSSQNAEGAKLPYNEILDNAKDMAIGSLGPSIALSAIFNLLNFRKPWSRNPQGKLQLRSPIDPVKKYYDLKNKKNRFKLLLRNIKNDTIKNTATAALIAGAVPLFSSKLNINDRALKDAANIIHRNPQITALPAAELLSILPEQKEKSKLKDVLTGAGLGVGAAMPGVLIPSALGAIGKSISDKSVKGLGKYLLNNLRKNTLSTMIAGGSLGALSGLLTNRFNRQNYEKDLYDKI